MKIRKSTWIIIFSFAIGLGIPVILSILFPSAFFSSREQIRSYLMNYGYYSPLIFVFLSIIPVVITPLNHSIFGLAAGFIYGPWIGFLLSWIAKLIGTIVNFLIGRIVGKKTLRRWASDEVIQDYDLLFEKHKFALFSIYFVPFLTNDMLSYFAGASNLSFRTFFPIMFFGQIGTCFSLAYIGSGAKLNDPLLMGIFVVILVITIYYLYNRPHTQRVE